MGKPTLLKAVNKGKEDSYSFRVLSSKIHQHQCVVLTQPG